MELYLLEAFVAVAQRGSFSGGGEQLHLTQPAVSKRVRQLEEQLGTPLFDRIGRRIDLTEAGRALLPRARHLLNEARDLYRLIDNLDGEVRGPLVMGTSHHIGLHRLPGPLKHFTRTFPEVELDIRFMDSEAACHAVEIGDLELAIVTLPPEPLPRLRVESIWDDPLCFVVGLDHPFACRETITLEELTRYPAVLPSSNTYTRGVLERAVRDRRLSLRTGMETNYLETLRMLAEAGLGWTLLPATQLTEQLRVLQVKGLALRRQLGAVTHERRCLSNAARQMIAACLQVPSP